MVKSQDNYLSIIKIVIGLLFCLALFPSNIKSVIIIVSGIVMLSTFLKKKQIFKGRYFLINTFFFFFLIATTFYSQNLVFASKKIETMLSLAVFPLLFSFLDLDHKKEIDKLVNKYLLLYIFSIFLFNIIPFLWFYITNYSFLDLLHHFKYIIVVDIGKYTIHPIYMSMHCCLAIIFSLYLFKKIKNKKLKIVLVLINIIIFFFLLVYARKGPFIAFLITLFTWSFFELKKYLKYYLLFIIIIIGLLAILPNTRNRFLELKKIELATKKTSSSTNIRYTIYKNSLKLIKASPVLGYGIGDYNDELKKTYKKNASFLLEGTYNSHNQYLSFLLIGGIVLLILFLYFYLTNLSISIKNNNILSILIFVFYGVMMFFENILERESGVIFFSFFINFFAIKNYINFEKE